MSGDPMDATEPPFDETLGLIRRAGQGDERALSDMVRRYQGPLLERVRGLMGPVPREFAESVDVLQDLFVEILRDFDGAGIRDEEAFLRWATQVARNNIRDQLRRRRLRAMEGLASNVLGAERSGIGVFTAPSQAAAREDELARLEAVLGQLPEDYRRVIELKDLEQRSYREITEILGRPSEAATQMLHARALGRLVEKLTPPQGGASH